jgi:hypothetical protein
MATSNTTGRNAAYAAYMKRQQPSNQGVTGGAPRIVMGGAGKSGVKRNANGTIIAPGNSQTVRDFNDFNSAAPKFSGTERSTERANWAADSQAFALSGQPQNMDYPSPANPTSSGNGYSTSPAGIDQGTYNQLLSMFGSTKPKQWDYQDLELSDRGPFDSSQYDIAGDGIQQGFDDARARGTTAFDRSSAEIAGYENPYAQGVQQRTPGIDPALQRSMSAWGGAGSDAAAAEQQFGFNTDQGMDAMYDLLGRSEDSYTQGLQRGIAGDRMEFDQRMGGEQRSMATDLELRKAKAMQAFADAQNAREDQVAFANNAGQNQAGQYNNQSGNQYNSEAFNQFMSLVLGGMNGAGNQTLTDLTGGGAAAGIFQ